MPSLDVEYASFQLACLYLSGIASARNAAWLGLISTESDAAFWMCFGSLLRATPFRTVSRREAISELIEENLSLASLSARSDKEDEEFDIVLLSLMLAPPRPGLYPPLVVSSILLSSSGPPS